MLTGMAKRGVRGAKLALMAAVASLAVIVPPAVSLEATTLNPPSTAAGMHDAAVAAAAPVHPTPAATADPADPHDPWSGGDAVTNDVGPDDVLPGLPPKAPGVLPEPLPEPTAPPLPSPSPSGKPDHGEGPIIGIGDAVEATSLGVGVAGGSVNSALQTPDGAILAGGRESALNIFAASFAAGSWTTSATGVCAQCGNAWAAALSADGTKAYFAANSPSSLWEQDLSTGRLRQLTQVLPNALPYLGPGKIGAFDAATAPDGSVYLGSYGRLDPLGGIPLPGAVLRYNPATDRVSLVGTLHPGALMVRSVATAPDGTLFAGTSSGSARARLFFLRPGGTSFTEIPLGLAEMGASSVYDLAVVGDHVVGGAGENRGRLVIVDRNDPENGGRVIEVPGTTHIDLVAPVNQKHFVFSARSEGTIYLGDVETGQFKALGTPVHGDETRGLFTWEQDGASYLRGVSGSGIVWQVPAPAATDVAGWEALRPWAASSVVSASFQDVAGTGEMPVQGAVAAVDDTALVAGSWKLGIFQNGVRSDHYISGELKTVQGHQGAYYGATYPNAWVWRVGKDGRAELLAKLDRRYQSRPLSIDVDASGILIGTRANYGFAGGAVNYIATSRSGAPKPVVHVDPLGKGSINVVKHLSRTDALIASSVQAEAASAQEERAEVARINKVTGEVRWRAEFDTKAFMGAAVTPHGILLAAIGHKTLLLDPDTGRLLAQGIGPQTGRLVEVGQDAVVFLEHPWLVRMEVRPGGRLLATRHRLPQSAQEIVEIVQAGEAGQGGQPGSGQSGSGQPGPDQNTLYGIERRGRLLRLELTPARVWRTAGQDRYATAAAFVSSESTWEQTAVIASGSDYPDALAAAPLAAKLRAPVLLSAQSYLPVATRKALQRGGFTRVVLVGGHSSIGPAVEAQLAAMGVTVERLGGQSRFHTAALIAARVCPAQNCPAFVVSGSTFADALSAGAAASKTGGVVLLAQRGLPGGQSPWYTHAARRYVVGGLAASQLGTAPAEPTAVFAGPDRFATAASVGEQFFPDAGTAMLVSGVTFPDALAASGICALEGAPIVLATADTLPPATASYLRDSDVWRVEIAGGANSVTSYAQEGAFHAVSN